jgi:aspartate aminotransferase/aminotransferase
MDYLAERTGLMDASGIRKVFALAAKLKDPVNFSIGQPDFDVPEPVKEAAIEAIRKGKNSYSQTAGVAEVVACLKEKAKSDYGWDNSQLMLTDGVSGGLLLAFMALINPGDEVIMSDPYFVIYKHIMRICRYLPRFPTDSRKGWGCGQRPHKVDHPEFAGEPHRCCLFSRRGKKDCRNCTAKKHHHSQ